MSPRRTGFQLSMYCIYFWIFSCLKWTTLADIIPTMILLSGNFSSESTSFLYICKGRHLIKATETIRITGYSRLTSISRAQCWAANKTYG
jgi:hypothetical protein